MKIKKRKEHSVKRTEKGKKKWNEYEGRKGAHMQTKIVIKRKENIKRKMHIKGEKVKIKWNKNGGQAKEGDGGNNKLCERPREDLC